MNRTFNDYSQWLFNRYVEAVSRPGATVMERFHAGIWEEALRGHLEANLQGKRTALARKLARELLGQIRAHRSKGKRIAYTGDQARQLGERDDMLRRAIIQRISADSHAIGIPSMHTEIAAVRLLGKVLRQIDQFTAMQLSSTDDAHICGAANLLLRVLEANGYALNGQKKLYRNIKQVDDGR